MNEKQSIINENEIKEHKTRENKKQNSFLFINLIYNLVVNHYCFFIWGVEGVKFMICNEVRLQEQ